MLSAYYEPRVVLKNRGLLLMPVITKKYYSETANLYAYLVSDTALNIYPHHLPVESLLLLSPCCYV